MIKVILWDIDGTLLDFKSSESYAIKACFKRLRICENTTDEMVARYSAINHRMWNELAEGGLTKKEVLNGRFEEFFRLEGIDYTDYERLNGEYQIALGEAFFFHDGGLEAVTALKGRYRQYAVTNGTATAQHKKLALSGLKELFDGVFISDEVGFDKPAPEFFDRVFSAIGNPPREQAVIIGDSLSSDMLGGNNAGIHTVLFDPTKTARIPDGLRIDATIASLCEVENTLERL